MTFTIHGISASKGIAIGRVRIVDRGRPEVAERSLDPSRIEAEVKRFRRAVQAARRELRSVKARIPKGTPKEIAAFIDAHLLMLEDEAISKAPVARLREKRCNAEWALKLERDALIAVFDEIDDPYLHARKDDVEHVVNRVQIHLQGRRRKEPPPGESTTGKIIHADDLTPADTVLMQHQGVAGFMTEFGGAELPHRHPRPQPGHPPPWWACIAPRRCCATATKWCSTGGRVSSSSLRTRPSSGSTSAAAGGIARIKVGAAQAPFDADGDRGRRAGDASGQRRAARRIRRGGTRRRGGDRALPDRVPVHEPP